MAEFEAKLGKDAANIYKVRDFITGIFGPDFVPSCNHANPKMNTIWNAYGCMVVTANILVKHYRISNMSGSTFNITNADCVVPAVGLAKKMEDIYPDKATRPLVLIVVACPDGVYYLEVESHMDGKYPVRPWGWKDSRGLKKDKAEMCAFIPINDFSKISGSENVIRPNDRPEVKMTATGLVDRI